MAKILHIEDDAAQAYMARLALETVGHEVTWSRDVKEGIEQANSVSYDVIICDGQIGCEDGFSLAMELAEQGHKTMSLSASRPPDGFNRPSVGKPFSMKRLIAVVEKLLNAPD